jgi:transglutaminase-like putative cysteine protease
MTNRPFIGLFLALCVESAYWVRVRWEFDDEACSKAWQFTAVAIGLATVLIWLDGSRLTALPNLLTWLPPLLLPMQFVQSFGLRDSLPLNTFSFLAKHRRKRNLRLGLTESVVRINFGNIHFVTAIVGATLGKGAASNEWAFLTGVLILVGSLMLYQTRSRPLALLLALITAGGLAVAGETALKRAEDWISSGGLAGTAKFNPNSVSTLIGRPGRVQQSPDIVWRLSPAKGSAAPRLLRTASYNNYRTSIWETQRVTELDFQDLTTRPASDGGVYYIAKEDAELGAVSDALPRFNLRGTAANETPLPVPGDTASLRDFALDGIDRNTFGSIRVFPKSSVIDGVVLWKGGTNPEGPPVPQEDFQIQSSERKTIRETALAIGLYEMPELQAKLDLLRNWFAENFKYSRNLTIYSPSQVAVNPSGISQFLTKNRVGHCEYFATATALLLREAGIPTRYAIGFGVIERDFKRDEFLIRGTHGHAWCRVWDEKAGVWIDFDTTPPAGLAGGTPPQSSSQWFSDNVKRFREDFFLWRNRPNNRLAVTLVMSLVALAVLVFVMRRLWRSKRRLENLAAFHAYDGPIIRTPLHNLEAAARKHLGYRPPGLPFGEWLLQLRPQLENPALLDEALLLHQRLRFDPAPMNAGERERLQELASQLADAFHHARQRAA